MSTEQETPPGTPTLDTLADAAKVAKPEPKKVTLELTEQQAKGLNAALAIGNTLAGKEIRRKARAEFERRKSGQRQVDALDRNLAGLEHELKRRRDRFDDGIADLRAAGARLKSSEEEMGKELAAYNEALRVAEAAIAAKEREVAAMREELAKTNAIAKERMSDLLANYETAKAAAADLPAREREFERATAGLRKDIDNTRRRLAIARVRHGIPEETPAPPAEGTTP